MSNKRPLWERLVDLWVLYDLNKEEKYYLQATKVVEERGKTKIDLYAQKYNIIIKVDGETKYDSFKDTEIPKHLSFLLEEYDSVKQRTIPYSKKNSKKNSKRNRRKIVYDFRPNAISLFPSKKYEKICLNESANIKTNRYKMAP